MSRNDFNFIAPFYDHLTGLIFNNQLHLSQIHFLPEVKHKDTILIVGGGTGKVLVTCLENNPSAKIHYVDNSRKMIQLAKALVEKDFPTQLNAVEFEQRDIRSFNSSKKYDLIILPFVLDLFGIDELELLLSSLKRYLNNEGLLIHTDFKVENKNTVISLFNRIVVSSMYLFFHLVSGVKTQPLPDFSALFLKTGFVLRKEKFILRGLISSSIYAVPISNK